jgi:hypothetical protein
MITILTCSPYYSILKPKFQKMSTNEPCFNPNDNQNDWMVHNNYNSHLHKKKYLNHVLLDQIALLLGRRQHSRYSLWRCSWLWPAIFTFQWDSAGGRARQSWCPCLYCSGFCVRIVSIVAFSSAGTGRTAFCICNSSWSCPFKATTIQQADFDQQQYFKICLLGAAPSYCSE